MMERNELNSSREIITYLDTKQVSIGAKKIVITSCIPSDHQRLKMNINKNREKIKNRKHAISLKLNT